MQWSPAGLSEHCLLLAWWLWSAKRFLLRLRTGGYGLPNAYAVVSRDVNGVRSWWSEGRTGASGRCCVVDMWCAQPAPLGYSPVVSLHVIRMSQLLRSRLCIEDRAQKLRIQHNHPPGDEHCIAKA